ncbi:pyridine nucleotide-disulfide oxidoreductase [Nocardioides silvaticus]|uniref:Pyridine nucleotide-disulfide oxidoreductase n=1 Tax=Nocardioides silvaticus TaxID=2201891 RepID=A0A316TM01_9ACTN|nr:FAD-dependent oxidoreductase [Nocardioides silvaticus]PWN04671.1 pyridine nucleotide-disulfide oxidoreductase [Nocardioides silvaticus]
MTTPRVVVAGLGDSGLLTAVHLARPAGRFDIVGISSKPGLVSGQELGLRLTRPERWRTQYWTPFDRYRRLDRLRVVHGTLTALDADHRRVSVALPDGTTRTEPYDVLVVSTGVTNGFWRRPQVQTVEQVDADLRAAHDRLAAADSVLVVGGGAAAVSCALNVATRWPDKQVDLCFPGERALTQHHPRVWSHVRKRLSAAGVALRPGHRAELPEDGALDRIGTGPVTWSTGQEPTPADAVLWTVGRVRPNTAWLPAELLDEDGFVRVRPTLQTAARPEIFAIGDVAATDPLRSSARNRADHLLAANIRAHLGGKPLGTFEAPRSRWGSVVGPQHDGLQVFAPSGKPFRLPDWFVWRVMYPGIVRRGIYKGVRRG